MNSEFEDANNTDFYPENLRSEIDTLIPYIQEKINIGVYKTGLAPNQQAYDHMVDSLFEALHEMEKRLAGSRFLCHDNNLTIADIRLFTTLVRFDHVYYFIFKCNKERLQDFG